MQSVDVVLRPWSTTVVAASTTLVLRELEPDAARAPTAARSRSRSCCRCCGTRRSPAPGRARYSTVAFTVAGTTVGAEHRDRVVGVALRDPHPWPTTSCSSACACDIAYVVVNGNVMWKPGRAACRGARGSRARRRCPAGRRAPTSRRATIANDRRR